MHLKRTRVEVPLPVEYTRVTNPERLLPLHDLAVDIMTRLRDEYEVIETQTFELTSRMRAFAYARPPITLAPISQNEAPISVAFTQFPSLIVRSGKFFNASFPVCGCDACAPTFEGEAERLQATIRSVVAGHFREELDIPLVGRAHLSWSLTEGPYASTSSRMMLPRDDARQLSSRSKRIEWHAWTKRASNSALLPRAF
jgi:hypothetical protein